MRLLHQAWCEYDVTMSLAGSYKLASKALFLLQLLLAWVVVLLTTFAMVTNTATALEEVAEWSNETAVDAPVWDPSSIFPGLSMRALNDAAFILNAVVGLLVSVDSFINSKARWRRLRNGAGALHSTIWCYRTRVGAFELSNSLSDTRASEIALRDALVHWRRDLVAGGDLQMTSIKKKHSPRIFKHHQYGGSLKSYII